jgi:phospholipid/cholesterol/gamma-HCH transport system ATP-binding protein
LIIVNNLWKSYQGNPVLRNLSLKVETGETLVILGRSGAGKSVLLRHIIGILKPDQGEIEIGGVKVSSLKGENRYLANRNIGMLFQNGALFDSMTIEENVGFYLKEHRKQETGEKYSKEEIKEAVSEAIEMVGLQGSEKKLPSALSGGMKKRAALARLIVYKPKYLLYDEPTTGLDPVTARQINELILLTQKKLHATSIVVTHDIYSALYVADRFALHKEGAIAYIDYPTPFFRIDDPDITFLSKMINQDVGNFRSKNNE